MKKEKKTSPFKTIIVLVVVAMVVGGLIWWQQRENKELGSDLKPSGDCAKTCQYVSEEEKSSCLQSCQSILQGVADNPEIRLKN